MYATIYDYRSNSRIIEIDENKLKMLIVTILSGDEVVCVINEDNSSTNYDALEDDERSTDIYDGMYIVEPHELQHWINLGLELEPLAEESFVNVVSYQRQEKFLKWQEGRGR